MPSSSHALPPFRRAFRAFVRIVLVAATFVAIGCKPSIDGDVYSLASEHVRVIAPALIAPGTGADYAFTIESVPSIEIVSPVSGATAWYSIDGGEYRAYESPFALSVADPKVEQTITVTAYLSHPKYRSSDPVKQVYRFVATTVPSPTISASAGAEPFHEYYRYNAPPMITASCSLPDATIRYTLNGGTTYFDYTVPFTLPVPSDWSVNREITVTMYASSPGYRDSVAESATYTFYGRYAIVTIAGNGTSGSAGDGDDARLAQLNLPQGVCVDNEKNVYIADRSNNKIRMVRASDGHIVTIAGTGYPGNTGNGGYATSADIDSPISVAIDPVARILYFADYANSVVRAIDLESGYISHFSGGGSTPVATGVSRENAGNFAPFSIYYASGKLFIADFYGFIAFVDANVSSSNPMTLISGLSQSVSGMYLVSSTLYMAYQAFPTIGVCNSYDVSPSITDINLTGLMSGAYQPCVDGANIYFTETSGNRVSFYDGSSYHVISGTTAGTPASLADEVDGAMAGVPSLNTPMGMFLVPNDGLYIADRGNNRIRKVILY